MKQKLETNISFEDRTYFNFYYNNIAIPHETEKMLSEDLITFLEGFAPRGKMYITY